MVHCYMCDKDVEKYKTNSHVIPRCLFIPVKDNGKMVSIDNFLKENKFSGQELIGEFICEECEQKTRKDDAFAKEFFIDKKYLIECRNKIDINGYEIDLNKLSINSELYNREFFYKFKKFIFSIILRYYCFLTNDIKNKENILLRNHLKNMRKQYHGNLDKLLDSKYPIIMWKYNDKLNRLIAYPKKYKLKLKHGFERNYLDIIILGYRIHIFTNRIHFIPGNLDVFKINSFCFNCYELIRDTQLHLDIMSSFLENEPLGKLKEEINCYRRSK